MTSIEIRCPADGRVVGTVPSHSDADVRAVAAELLEAQPAWEAIGPAGRARYLLTWLDWLLDHQHRLAELVQSESGKAWGDALLETAVVIDLIKYYAKHAADILRPREVRPHSIANVTKRLELGYRPYPLVGLITPWNGPIGAPGLDSVPALMAGAAVLSKPSEVAPLSWTEVVRGWRDDVGAPAVLGVVNGGSATGAAVVDHVDMVMFTGSTQTGRKVAARAAERLIPYSLELGGKDAMIVLADADVDQAAAAATWGSMLNSGQLCVSIERAYVEAPIYDHFVAKVVANVSRLRQGTDRPGAFSSDLGAMATRAQLAIVEAHVADALAKGAKALTGGRRAGSGLYHEPTVLVDVDHSMLCMREETFGPTLPIMKVKDEAEALRLANDSPYGLSGSIWSRDRDRAVRLARQLEVGAVNVNNALVNLFQIPLPMAGWKQSGVGFRLGGANGLLKFCRPQSLVLERLTPPVEPYWFPQSPLKGRLIAAAVRFLGARDWRRRVGLQPKR